METLALPTGLKLKAGRFLSGVGYSTSSTPTEWDFSDAPLAYKAFFGYRLQNDGVQLRWVAPTDRCSWSSAPRRPTAASSRGPSARPTAPGLWTAFAHLGGDIGDSSAWRVGLVPRARPAAGAGLRGQNGTGSLVNNAFSGRSQTWIADFIYKWAPTATPPSAT